VATNLNLDALKETGAFRKDLYFRLCAHKINLPPLRERCGDLPLLLHHFITETAAALGKKKPVVPEEIYIVLNNYHFPGNIRELKSIVLDAMSRHRDGIMSLDSFRALLGGVGTSANAIAEPETGMGTNLLFPGHQLPTMKDARRLLVEEAMRRANNNRSIAARLLGITRQSLTYHLQKPEPEGDRV